MDYMETAMSYVVRLEPDQLRSVIAQAAGLHAKAAGIPQTSTALRRIADRLDDQSAGDRMEIVIHRVALQHQIAPSDIRAKSRKRHISWARAQAAYEMRQFRGPDGGPKFSLGQIARALGCADHTSTVHLCRKHERLMREQREAA